MTAVLAVPWKPVAAAGAAALLVAAIGGTVTDIGPWYQGLQKPPWQPPDWAFAPAWTLIYALAALSAAMAWHAATRRSQREWLVGLFTLNGFLNVLWSLLFFRLQRPDLALIEVAFLWLSVALLIAVLWRYAQRASLLLVPYLIWVSFAATLNLTVVRLNEPF